MKRLIVIVALLFGGMSTYAHDIKVGIFDIYLINSEYHIDMKFDRLDFINCIKTNFNTFNSYVSPENLTAYTEQYLISNLGIEIDGNCVEPTISSINYENDFIVINALLSYDDKHVDSIKIKNTCMLDILEGYTNIMKFDLMNRNRSFRLNAQRTSTVVKY